MRNYKDVFVNPVHTSEALSVVRNVTLRGQRRFCAWRRWAAYSWSSTWASQTRSRVCSGRWESVTPKQKRCHVMEITQWMTTRTGVIEICLSEVGRDIYQLLTDLCSPNKAASKTLDHLLNKLNGHLNQCQMRWLNHLSSGHGYRRIVWQLRNWLSMHISQP